MEGSKCDDQLRSWSGGAEPQHMVDTIREVREQADLGLGNATQTCTVMAVDCGEA